MRNEGKKLFSFFFVKTLIILNNICIFVEVINQIKY